MEDAFADADIQPDPGR